MQRSHNFSVSPMSTVKTIFLFLLLFFFWHGCLFYPPFSPYPKLNKVLNLTFCCFSLYTAFLLDFLWSVFLSFVLLTLFWLQRMEAMFRYDKHVVCIFTTHSSCLQQTLLIYQSTLVCWAQRSAHNSCQQNTLSNQPKPVYQLKPICCLYLG